MSEFTNNAEQRAEELANYMQELLQGENGLQLIENMRLKRASLSRMILWVLLIF